MSDQTIPLHGAKVQTRQLKPSLALDTMNLYSNKMADAVALHMTTPRSCLTVPLSAITNPSRNEVFVVEDGKIYRREIETGSDAGTFIEVVKGLRENELVVTSDTDGLEDGMKATVTLEGGEDIG